MTKPDSYHHGYQAMRDKLELIAWTAARDEFNLVHPPGQPEKLSTDGYWYAQGEFRALCDTMPRN